MFRSSHTRTHLFQIVFSKGNINKDNYPMSRAFLYENDIARQTAHPTPALARARSRAMLSYAERRDEVVRRFNPGAGRNWR